jgi:protease IV
MLPLLFAFILGNKTIMNTPAVKKPSLFTRFFSSIWNGMNFIRRFVTAIIAIAILSLFLSGLFSGDAIEIKDGSALILKPNGILVEQKTYADPVASAMNSIQGQDMAQTLVSDLLTALERAKTDERISSMVINTNSFVGGSVAHLQTIRDAIIEFKATGKPVYAYGSDFSQSQYYLASLADEVSLNPEGAVMMYGFGRFGTYFKDALEAMKVKVHVFKVGSYKSAVEPFTRGNMSDFAKEANKAWLGDLWQLFKQDVAANRSLSADDIQAFIDDSPALYTQAKGIGSEVAISSKMVDAIKTESEMVEYLQEKVGKDEESFKSVFHADYLKETATLPIPQEGDKVAVIVAKGSIVGGYQKPGTIGDRSLNELIKKARNDKSVKAVVLRIDSGGGSKTASEMIRQEILKTKSEKPVIVSMAGVAASGGYWIAADANEIWASPSTITGSIGIYGMIPTFEETAEEFFKVREDGIGTTKFAGSMSTLQPMNPHLAEIVQINIESGYQQFLEVVANGRGMTSEDVDKIAQGRVWSGLTAKEIGLVDNLGDLDDAIKSAASLAQLDKYEVKLIEQEESAKDKLLRDILNSSIGGFAVEHFAPELSMIEIQMQKILNKIESIRTYNDPSHAYVRCDCNIDL